MAEFETNIHNIININCTEIVNYLALYSVFLSVGILIYYFTHRKAFKRKYEVEKVVTIGLRSKTTHKPIGKKKKEILKQLEKVESDLRNEKFSTVRMILMGYLIGAILFLTVKSDSLLNKKKKVLDGK